MVGSGPSFLVAFDTVQICFSKFQGLTRERERRRESARARERESDGARARARAREESEEASRPRGIDCSWLIVVVGPDWESGSGTIEPGLALRLLPFAQPLPVTGAAAPKAASSRRPRAIPGPGRLSGRARCALRLDRQQRALAAPLNVGPCVARSLRRNLRRASIRVASEICLRCTCAQKIRFLGDARGPWHEKRP
jgi:hypothetical protein